MNALFQIILPLLPEIYLAVAGLIILLAGLYASSGIVAKINLMVIFSFVACMLFVYVPESGKFTIWNNLLIVNGYTQCIKTLVLLAASLTLLLASTWLQQSPNASGRTFEYSVLTLFSVLGMLLLSSANDLIIFYLSIELMSLPLYLLAAIDRDSLRSTEAGIKYFVLGSLASGMMLFGMSLVYGFEGTTNFTAIANVFTHNSSMGMHVPPGVLLGIILILTGLFFKISAAPFHMWTPDVYEGIATPTTAFFAAAPKVVVVAFLARILIQPFGPVIDAWQQILVFVAILTMLTGALGALWQTNIKRLLAYSSIGHVGYLLVGVSAGSVMGLKGIIIYLTLYIFMTVGSFGLVLMMKRQGEAVEDIRELAGLSKTNPKMAFAFSVLLFSMAGIPPLSGFFGKLFVFVAALKAGLNALVVIGLLSSVIACYYYIKLVKIMYFDEARSRFDTESPLLLRLVVALSVFVTLFYILIPAPLINFAGRAAEAALM